MALGLFVPRGILNIPVLRASVLFIPFPRGLSRSREKGHESQAEETLINREITEARAAEAGKAASVVCRPISDIRSSLAYRCSMVEVLTQRAILEAYRRIR